MSATDTVVLLTVNEAAATLRLHPVTVRRMALEGRLAGAVKIGSRWRFRADELGRPLLPVRAGGEPPAPGRRRGASWVPERLDRALDAHRPEARR